MLRATEYVILRDVEANGLKKIPVEREPKRVLTMINEDLFNELNQGLIHNRTVFFEDHGHDWNWRAGAFRYYSRVADVASVVLVYAEIEDTKPLFCPQCGKRLPQDSTTCASCQYTVS
ncbi:zinc ribbon domain-containing protein [Pseudomonas luteola]